MQRRSFMSQLRPNTAKQINKCKYFFKYNSVQFSSVTQLCPTLCDPVDCSTPGFPVHHQLRSLLKLMSIKSVMPSNHLILCRPLLLLPSIFPSIRVLSNESVLHIRGSKYWHLIRFQEIAEVMILSVCQLDHSGKQTLRWS